MYPNIIIEKLRDDVIIPRYQTIGSAGMDIYAPEDATLYDNKTTIISLSFKLEIPKCYEVQIRPRSSLAIRHNIIIPNSPGTIDSDYRGEVKVALRKLEEIGTDSYFEIKKGDRIAQMIICPVIMYDDALIEGRVSDTVRGQGGIGSTGR